MSKPTVQELLAQPKEQVLEFLGKIYEHSSWIAEKFYQENIEKDDHDGNIQNVNDLFLAMQSIVDNSSTDQKLELLKAHPGESGSNYISIVLCRYYVQILANNTSLLFRYSLGSNNYFRLLF